jgi:hypothetical protein
VRIARTDMAVLLQFKRSVLGEDVVTASLCEGPGSLRQVTTGNYDWSLVTCGALFRSLRKGVPVCELNTARKLQARLTLVGNVTLCNFTVVYDLQRSKVCISTGSEG